MKPITTIPITDLCLDYRDDILLRIFVLCEQRYDVWDAFCLLLANRKNKKQSNKLMRMAQYILKKGQPEPIKVVRVDGKIYPAMGATRIAVMRFLCFQNIEIIECTKEEAPKWNKSWKLHSKYFVGMSKEMLEDFVCWKKEYYATI